MGRWIFGFWWIWFTFWRRAECFPPWCLCEWDTSYACIQVLWQCPRQYRRLHRDWGRYLSFRQLWCWDCLYHNIPWPWKSTLNLRIKWIDYLKKFWKSVQHFRVRYFWVFRFTVWCICWERGVWGFAFYLYIWLNIINFSFSKVKFFPLKKLLQRHLCLVFLWGGGGFVWEWICSSLLFIRSFLINVYKFQIIF